MNNSDTIAAVATGGTVSAIGIVRVSGEKALTAADSMFSAACGRKLTDAANRQMYYGRLTDIDGELIDLCLCMVSRAPDSYTGEDTVEFHCHGSPVVLSEVLHTLFQHGVRQAEAGEFTKRAFLSGRMDLTQAEAVIDLIEAETLPGAKNAAAQLGGAVLIKINAIYNKLLDITAHFHAVIDYPDEDIEEFKISEYMSILSESGRELRSLLETHERGKILKNGIPAVIAGRTNAGKSSLLNALLGYERAIVTEVHGTTRDTVEEKVLIGNVLLRLIDTAGLRKTDDAVEKLGVERTVSALGEAGLILLVLDSSEPLQDEDYDVMKTIRDTAPDTPLLTVANKCDKGAVLPAYDAISLSAKTGEGIGRLCAEIQKLFPDPGGSAAGGIITSARQAQALTEAVNHIQAAQTALASDISPDAILTDIEAALTSLGEVTGKTIREDIISRIFDRFCVGK